MKKLYVFDLDGVLIDAKNIHYDSLNEALGSFGEKYIITWNEHLSKYDGLKTSQKLEMLSKDKGLPNELHKQTIPIFLHSICVIFLGFNPLF